MGPAEPCNHEQMTELPGSASKKLARVLNASSQSAWAKSVWFILQKLSWTHWFYHGPTLLGTQFSNTVRGLNLPSLVTENP